MPVFLVIAIGAICYGALYGLEHGLNELAGEAARASVAGLDDAEREELARAYVAQHARDYAFVDPGVIRVRAAPSESDADVFSVSVSYDASGLFVYGFKGLVPLPRQPLTARAAVVRGGY